MDKLEIEDVKRLDVREGDNLLVTIPSRYSDHQIANIREAFAGLVPQGKVVVVPRDIQVSIVREHPRGD